MANKTKRAGKAALDGAMYPSWTPKGTVPSDYYSDPETGLRPGETKRPSQTMLSRLDSSLVGIPIPPRSIWKEGHWKSSNEQETWKEAYRTWVVSGEGTPANYMWREYVLPSDLVGYTVPPHPADWPKEKVRTTGKTTGSTTGGSSYYKSSLPFGLRFRCKCGHWFKEADLADHVKNCCPVAHGDDTDWAIECECCHSLDDTVKIKPGFPRDEPAPAPTEAAEAT